MRAAVLNPPGTASGRDDYIEYVLDPAALARQFWGDGILSVLDTSVLPSVQRYVEHTETADFDPDFLWRVSEFLALMSSVAIDAHVTILPSIARESDGMMGALDRRARARAKEAPSALAAILGALGEHAKSVEVDWRKRSKRPQHDAVVGQKHPAVWPAVRRVLQKLPLRAVAGKADAYSAADIDLAAYGIAAALTAPGPARIFTRDQDILVLADEGLTTICGALDLECDEAAPLTVLKFDGRGTRATYAYKAMWDSSQVSEATARRRWRDTQGAPGLKTAMDVLDKAL